MTTPFACLTILMNSEAIPFTTWIGLFPTTAIRASWDSWYLNAYRFPDHCHSLSDECNQIVPMQTHDSLIELYTLFRLIIVTISKLLFFTSLSLITLFQLLWVISFLRLVLQSVVRHKGKSVNATQIYFASKITTTSRSSERRKERIVFFPTVDVTTTNNIFKKFLDRSQLPNDSFHGPSGAGYFRTFFVDPKNNLNYFLSSTKKKYIARIQQTARK